MASTRTKTAIGVAMVALGVLQAVAYALQAQVVPAVLGGVYATLGVAYLWAEVLRVEDATA
ncbi:hypothetical protein [Halorubellus salinus]|uniref:hypothetical protein n=1 Tax=Halorubellus salinus TaxID=755309 RepID=UPI001D06203F|nr:hypothetical protein [Halorubellus salinus]